MEEKRLNSYPLGLTYRWSSLLFISCFYFFLAECSWGQTVIRGKVDGFNGSTISVSRHLNFITNAKTELAAAVIGEEGTFELQISETHSEFILVNLDHLEFPLFARYGESYVVEIGQFSSGSNRVALKVVEAPDPDANSLIPEFDDHFAHLTDTLYPYIVKSGKRAMVDSMFDELANTHKRDAGPFMRTYIDNKTALVKQMTHKSMVPVFEKEYLIDKPIEEDHFAYMGFVNQYFSNYLLMLAMNSKGKKIVELINVDKDINGILKVLGQDEKLANDTLRELILLKGLYEVYYDPDYKEQMVLDLLDSMAVKTKIEMHVDLAKNIKKTLLRLRVGSMAPDFELMDESGNLVKLSDLQGKYIYLDFWATWCMPCLQEMDVMPSLVKKYGDQVTFVSVSIDKKYETMQDFLKKKKLIHPENKSKEYYLHYGRQKSVQADYLVKAIPVYVFIDREGKILKAPAERPSGKIEKTFRKEILGVKDQPSISDPGGN